MTEMTEYMKQRERERFARAEAIEKGTGMEAGREVTTEFLIDGFAGNRVFIGRHYPENRWNGWANPRFPLATAIEIAGLSLADADSGHVALSVDLTRGEMVLTLDPETWGEDSGDVFGITVDSDGSRWVDMGHGWTWMEVDEG